MNRNIQVILSANATSFAAQMRTASMSVGQFGTEAEAAALRTDASSRRALDTVGKLSLAVGAGLAIALGASVKAAADFDREMHNVATISDDVKNNFDRASDSLIAMSRTLPQSAKELASGLYDIASAGFQGSEGMSVLKASAMAASAGLSTTAVAGRGITAVLNAYGMSGYEAAKVSDILFQTVNLGVVTFEELASTLGDFVGTAAQLGVPIDEASAALATMTLSGVSASEAGTSLNRVMIALIKPSDEMAKTLKSAGYESGVAAVQALGLKGTMDMLRESTGGNIVALQALFPEIRGLKGALALMSDDGQTYTRVAAGITDETARMGATQRAFNEQSKSFSFQLEIAKNNLSAVGIEIGRTVLPALTELARLIGGVLAGFESMPEPLKVATGGLAAIVSVVATVGGAFVLLAPKIEAVKALWASLAETSPALASGLTSVGMAAGVVAVALVGLAVIYGSIAAQHRDMQKTVDAIVDALHSEASGMQGATDAALQAQLVQKGLIGQAAELGISYRTLTDAVKGVPSAMAEVEAAQKRQESSASGWAKAVGFVTSALEYLEPVAKLTGDTHKSTADKVDAMRQAYAKATDEMKKQEDQTNLLMQVTGKSKKELVDLGLATETSGDKIEALAGSVGLTSKALEQFGVEGEDATKAWVKSVTDIMEATQKAFQKDFDVVAQFSASNWAKMQKDAESGSAAVVAAEGKLADARQAQSELEDRLHAKATLTVADHQDLAHAADKVTDATKALSDAQANAGTQLGSLSSEVESFYKTSLVEAQAFTDGISRAIQLGLDPSAVSRLLQEGPKQAAPILQEIMSSHGARLVEIMNEGEAALSKSSTLAVETARLTGIAISSKTGQMVIDLQTAMKIAQAEAASGGKLTMDALVFSMNMGYQQVKDIVDEFGIVVPTSLGTAGQQGAANFATGLAPIAPSSDSLVRAVDASFKDVIGPLPPYTKMEADQIAAMWKLGTDPLPGDTDAVLYLIDSKIRGVLAALPGFTNDTANQLEAFWRTGLDPLPGDTDARAQGTATMLHNALDPLPGDARDTSYRLVDNWLNELARGEGGTSAQTAAWARAMLDVLNPMRTGVGADPITTPTGETYIQGQGGKNYAEGGIEDHVAQIAPAGAWRVWAEPETGGEAYIPLAEDKRTRSISILLQVARRFGLALVHEAYGGILDDLGLPKPPTLGEYGSMVGNTGERDDGDTYNLIRSWVEEENRKKAASGPAPPGTVRDWVAAGLSLAGRPADWVDPEARIAMFESGGDPHAQNNWDSNAAAGTPSKGLMQTIDPTFQAYKVLGHDDIWNPVDDVAAASNYIASRYGNPWNTPGERSIASGGPYQGYAFGGIVTFDKGGILRPGYTLAYNGTGSPELVARFADGGATSIVNTGQMSTSTQRTGATGSVSNTTNISSTAGTDGASAPTSVTTTGGGGASGLLPGDPGYPQPYRGMGGNLGGFAARTAYRLVTGQRAVYDDNLNGLPDAWEPMNQAPPGVSMGMGGGGSTSIDSSINMSSSFAIDIHVQPGASESAIEAVVRRAVDRANQALVDQLRTQLRARIRV